MSKIKRFVDCYLPTTTCNLRCTYCYVAQQNLFVNKPMKLEHTPEEIRQAFSQERLGGVCCINLCAGGETLLAPEVLDIIRVFLQNGHCVMVVSNGLLSARYDELAAFPPELLRRLFIKFSFRYMELKRLNAFQTYFDNVHKMDRAGVSFPVQLIPHDALIPLLP